MKELFFFLLICSSFTPALSFDEDFVPVTFSFNVNQLKKAIKNNRDAVDFRLKFLKSNGTNVPKMITLSDGTTVIIQINLKFISCKKGVFSFYNKIYVFYLSDRFQRNLIWLEIIELG